MTWTDVDVEQLCQLLPEVGLVEAAKRLGRPYQGVAIKAASLGAEARRGGSALKKPKRGAGLDKKRTLKLAKELRTWRRSLGAFCRPRKIKLPVLLAALAQYDPGTLTAMGLRPVCCLGCGLNFYPTKKHQTTCSSTCIARRKRDLEYFGGDRMSAVGFIEQVCQLCLQSKVKGLSSHHLIGKGNDPENKLMVALCTGCHQLVTQLSMRNFLDDPAGWERLIGMVGVRRRVRLHTFEKVATVKARVELRELSKASYCNEDGIDPADFARLGL